MRPVAEQTVEVVTPGQINRAIRKQLTSTPSVTIDGLKGQDHVAPGLGADSFITVNGSAGDHFAAFNRGAVVTLNGNAGRFAADTTTPLAMSSVPGVAMPMPRIVRRHERHPLWSCSANVRPYWRLS